MIKYDQYQINILRLLVLVLHQDMLHLVPCLVPLRHTTEPKDPDASVHRCCFWLCAASGLPAHRRHRRGFLKILRHDMPVTCLMLNIKSQELVQHIAVVHANVNRKSNCIAIMWNLCGLKAVFIHFLAAGAFENTKPN